MISTMFTDLGEVVTTVDYWLGIASSLFVLFIRHRIKIPKPVVGGSGGANKRLDDEEFFTDFRQSIINSPSFMGYPIARETLNIESARFYDPKTRKYEGGLMRWDGEPSNEPFRTEIKAGKAKSLYVYGVHKGRVHHFSGEKLQDIENAETLIELGNQRKLEIHITDSLRRIYKIPILIEAKSQRNSIDKVNVTIRTKVTFSDRWRQFRYGLRDMINAFTRPNY